LARLPSVSFVSVAGEMGLLTPQQTRESWAVSSQSRRVGLSESSICQRKGWLTRQQVDSVRSEIQRRGMTIRLGRYQIIDELGTGGNGRVYLAKDSLSGTNVALKILLLDDVDDNAALQRFEREAHLAAKVSHPALVQMLDAGSIDEKHYIVMEYVDGPTLADRTLSGPLDESDALSIVREVASALSALHRLQIIHRDVKPANIMLTRDGHAKLMDFGLAKCVKEESFSLTASDILGTPLYMPLEQFDSARTVDARADLYALGATLFHALTGRPPVAGQSIVEIVRCHQRPKPLPSDINPNVSPQADALCARLLAPNPKDRLQSAEETCAAIDACLGNNGHSARRGLISRRFRPWLRKHSRVTVGVSSACLLLAGAATGYSILTQRTSVARSPQPGTHDVTAGVSLQLATPSTRGSVVSATLSQEEIAKRLNRIVTLSPPYMMRSGTSDQDGLSVHAAVQLLLDQAVLPYDIETSLKDTVPQCLATVSPDIRNKPCREALDQLLSPMGLMYQIQDGKVVLVRKGS